MEVVRGEVRDGEIMEDGGVAREEDSGEGGGAADAGSWRRTRTGVGGGTGGEDGGIAVQRRRRRWLEDCSIAMTAGKNPWPGQGVAAVAARRRAAAAVGLLPRPSLSSHMRGRALLSFFK